MILQDAVAGKGPRYNKILVIVEGIYSMEGELCCLPDIVRVCKMYGAYIWLDEAHSIGAAGATGRGVCEELGVDPADVDIMMGTFTTSDAAASIAEVAQRPREIQRSRLSFLQTVGSGSGGVVQSAMLNEPGTPAFMCVVKSPLADAPKSARDALLHEAALMAQFSKRSSF